MWDYWGWVPLIFKKYEATYWTWSNLPDDNHSMKPLGPAVQLCLCWSPLGQNGRHFADDIFRCIFVNEKFCILIKISLKFVPKGPIDNNPVLVQNNGLAPKRRQAIIWTNAHPIHWRVYVTLVELINKSIPPLSVYSVHIYIYIGENVLSYGRFLCVYVVFMLSVK